jgi:hypothetical protein
VLLDGADSLFEPFDSILNLAVRKLDERTSFPELFVQMRSIICMTPIEVHLKSLSNELKFVPKSFSKDTRVSFAVSNLSPKGFSGSANNLLNLRERFLVHIPILGQFPRSLGPPHTEVNVPQPRKHHSTWFG